MYHHVSCRSIVYVRTLTEVLRSHSEWSNCTKCSVTSSKRTYKLLFNDSCSFYFTNVKLSVETNPISPHACQSLILRNCFFINLRGCKLVRTNQFRLSTFRREREPRPNAVLEFSWHNFEKNTHYFKLIQL